MPTTQGAPGRIGLPAPAAASSAGAIDVSEASTPRQSSGDEVLQPHVTGKTAATDPLAEKLKAAATRAAAAILVAGPEPQGQLRRASDPRPLSPSPVPGPPPPS